MLSAVFLFPVGAGAARNEKLKIKNEKSKCLLREE